MLRRRRLNELASGWGWWHNFYEFHKLAINELEAFDYTEYKKNGFKVNKLGDYDLTLDYDKKHRFDTLCVRPFSLEAFFTNVT